MQHEQLINFGKEILINQFGYDPKDIFEEPMGGYDGIKPDLYTQDKKYCVEAGMLSLNKFDSKEQRIFSLFKDYQNVIWIPYPKLTLMASIPLLNVFILTKDSFSFKLEDIEKKIKELQIKESELCKKYNEKEYAMQEIYSKWAKISELKYIISEIDEYFKNKKWWL